MIAQQLILVAYFRRTSTNYTCSTVIMLRQMRHLRFVYDVIFLYKSAYDDMCVCVLRTHILSLQAISSETHGLLQALPGARRSALGMELLEQGRRLLRALDASLGEP